MNSTPSTGPKANQARQANPDSAAAGGRWRLWVLIAAALAGGAYLTVSRMGKPRVPSAEASPVTPRPGIPVAAVQARLGDFNRYLSALGTVTPFNTVTVKSRVDGQIISVAFREGQIVHQGDLLLQIDPRPFQVQLEQAQGQLRATGPT